ncbi:MAG: LTA synthase family protein [Candidatus Gastranaerophilales bacterium]|nr:LTA synthase family protein [Candidatus Gastranaerophilales bacterium]
MKLNYKKISAGFLIFLSTLVIILVGYKIKNFGAIGIDELQFNIFNSVAGANYSTFISGVVNNILPFFLLFIILSFPFFNLYKNEKNIALIDKKPKRKIRRFAFWSYKKLNQHVAIYAIFIFIASIIYASMSLKLGEYVMAKSASSSFIADNYVDPKNVNLSFPDKKRNLIYIYLESMENTVLSIENGGASDVSLIPELENLSLDNNNVSFSNNSKISGMQFTYGTSWTVAGLVAQTAGVPILLMSSMEHNGLGEYKTFLPGAYSIGEVLENEGYYQQLLIGSEAAFGGRDKYFSQHGNYDIFDYNAAKEKSLINSDYKIWWGYEDAKLFDYAKNELKTISQNNQPFNFQLLTADTHFVDGYLDPSCEINFEDQYKNVYACSSKQVNEFVNWIKQQDFYENTTIIISGDHLGMQTEFYEELIDNNDYNRTIYSVIINSPIKKANDNDRIFTPFDMYPTTLSSLGVEIEGEKLGLGVNLFSGQNTLAEDYGIKYINEELQKRSEFYKNNILIK